MLKFLRYVLIVLTIICCLPFMFALASYVSWRQNSPPPTTADIGWGIVILSSYLAAVPLCLWACDGVYVFMTSTSLPLGPYFAGTKRRTGLVLLAVACILTAGWVRSFYTTDVLRILGGTLESRNGQIDRSATTSMVVGRIGGSVTSIYWSVPYVAILLPLTLLSAWQLLSKTRPAQTAKPELTSTTI